jgi:hypothetical protein
MQNVSRPPHSLRQNARIQAEPSCPAVVGLAREVQRMFMLIEVTMPGMIFAAFLP